MNQVIVPSCDMSQIGVMPDTLRSIMVIPQTVAAELMTNAGHIRGGDASG